MGGGLLVLLRRHQAFAWSLALAALILVSTLLRLLAAWPERVPTMLPDEYLYAALAHSLGGGALSVRGGHVAETAPLIPALWAPLWASLNPYHAYRAVQSLNALAFSLTAIPVWLTARRLGLERWQAFAAAAVSLAIADGGYVNFTSTEAVAYPLFMLSFYLVLRSLQTPSRASQGFLLVGLGLACGARVQFVALPLAFVTAVILVGLREGRLRARIREQSLALGALALVFIAAVLVKGTHAVGMYHSTLDWRPSPVKLMIWLGRDLYGLDWESGLVLLPVALTFLVLVLAKPKSTSDLAFAALATPLFVMLLIEGTYYAVVSGTAWNQLVFSRYFFYLTPLVAIGAIRCLQGGYADRRRLLPLLLASAAIPLIVPPAHFLRAYASLSSNRLFSAIFSFDRHLGSDLDSLLLLYTAVAVPLTLLALARRPLNALLFSLIFSFLLLTVTSVSSSQELLSRWVSVAQQREFPHGNVRWVDRLGGSAGTMLLTNDVSRDTTERELFFNPQMRLVLLPQTKFNDNYRTIKAVIDASGYVKVQGKRLTGPVLVSQGPSQVKLRDAKLLGIEGPFALWLPRTSAQLESFASGYQDGWMATEGELDFWGSATGEQLRGYLTVTLEGRGLAPATVSFHWGRHDVRVTVPKDRSQHRSVRLPVCANSHYRVTFDVTGNQLLPILQQYDDEAYAIRADFSSLHPQADACP